MLKVLRFILGIILIISGFVKLIDPLGFAYKLEEYYSPDVLNIPFLADYAYANGVLVSYAEVFLGVAIIFGWQYSRALILSILMFLFFAFLTFYSAYYNKVTDCGCFGDAIKFDPWQSFAKDLVLLLIAIILFIYRKRVKLMKYAIAAETVFALLAVFVVAYSYFKLPVIDFRPYKLGANIPELMSVPEGAEKDVVEDRWFYKVNGELREFTTKDEPWNIEGAEYVKRESVLLKKGYVPPINDFVLMENGEDKSGEVLAMDDVLWIVSKDLSALKTDYDKIQEIINSNDNVILITPSSDDLIKEFKSETRSNLRVFEIDHTTCKTIIRSNPGFLRVKNGIVTEKYSL